MECDLRSAKRGAGRQQSGNAEGVASLPLPRKRSVATLLIGGALVLAGCEEDWQAETYPARGTIAINGEPPAGAVVELHSTGEQPDVRNSRPWGIVQEDGRYALSTYEKGDGAPPGTYKVTVRWPHDVTQPSLVDRLRGAYATAEGSEWTVTVSEGENDLPPVEITGAKVLPKQTSGTAGRMPPVPTAPGGRGRG